MYILIIYIYMSWHLLRQSKVILKGELWHFLYSARQIGNNTDKFVRKGTITFCWVSQVRKDNQVLQILCVLFSYPNWNWADVVHAERHFLPSSCYGNKFFRIPNIWKMRPPHVYLHHRTEGNISHSIKCLLTVLSSILHNNPNGWVIELNGGGRNWVVQFSAVAAAISVPI